MCHPATAHQPDSSLTPWQCAARLHHLTSLLPRPQLPQTCSCQRCGRTGPGRAHAPAASCTPGRPHSASCDSSAHMVSRPACVCHWRCTQPQTSLPPVQAVALLWWWCQPVLEHDGAQLSHTRSHAAVGPKVVNARCGKGQADHKPGLCVGVQHDAALITWGGGRPANRRGSSKRGRPEHTQQSVAASVRLLGSVWTTPTAPPAHCLPVRKPSATLMSTTRCLSRSAQACTMRR